MDSHDLGRLREAVTVLENPTWIARITNTIGIPLEWAIKRLPKSASEMISRTTIKAIQRALVVAVSTMSREHHGTPYQRLHKAAVAISGGVGGFFSLPGLAVELPVSTVIMLRSIADIARSEGEAIGTVDSQLACVEVFALGGKKRSDDAAETRYYAVRVALARALSEVGEFIAEKNLVEEGAPIIARFIGRIASRFNVVVTEKAAVEIVPFVGAVGGATINLLFINHFQSMARGHFVVRSLERKYGEEAVKKEYEMIANEKSMVLLKFPGPQ